MIVVNGGSSSGKTSIVRHMQAMLVEPWLAVSIDDFVNCLPPTLQQSSDGFDVTADGTVQIGAALTMGFAIAGMHYTGMAAVQFKPSVMNIGNQVSGTDPQNLVYLITGVTLVVFVATYIFILTDQLSSKSAGAATD